MKPNGPLGRGQWGSRGVAIIGPGRVGQALGKLLARAGVPVRYVAARRASQAQRAVKFIGSGRAVGLDEPELARAPVLLLTTSDSALAPVARDLARLASDRRGQVVLQTSGSVSSSVLAPIRRRGAAVGSLHPYQTIPTPAAGLRALRNCYWGIEGDRKAQRVAESFAKLLGGTVFRVRPGRKTLYHASAFLTCPTVVTLMEHSMRLLRRAGVPAKIARPMLHQFVGQTLDNTLALGPRRALTGPAVRGDWNVVKRHLAALQREAPGIVPAYLGLLRAMLDLAGMRPPKSIARISTAR